MAFLQASFRSFSYLFLIFFIFLEVERGQIHFIAAQCFER